MHSRTPNNATSVWRTQNFACQQRSKTLLLGNYTELMTFSCRAIKTISSSNVFNPTLRKIIVCTLEICGVTFDLQLLVTTTSLITKDQRYVILERYVTNLPEKMHFKEIQSQKYAEKSKNSGKMNRWGRYISIDPDGQTVFQ